MNISRLGMFETNSSSTHCLVLNGPDELPMGLLDNLTMDPTIWTINSYEDSGAKTAKQKLDFFAGYIKQYSPTYAKSISEFERQLYWQTLCEVVKEQTGFSLYYPENNVFDFNDQSSDLSSKFRACVENKDMLRQAILNQIEYCKKHKIYEEDKDPVAWFNMGPGEREADISFWAHELKAFDESYDSEGKPKYECIF